ncbi:hypothetical protein OPV22_006140 [Ensete ventricosum]|uniref:Anaphase-promoting complex subunit 4 WD40 domain-containing protein n=1 Tax=Ensete ventricosum TaxID=4639 RepID=A0AAV8RMI2_ENSVE|nr:hypothetical protein OPV22_006140 [Ensete ventricosum]
MPVMTTTSSGGSPQEEEEEEFYESLDRILSSSCSTSASASDDESSVVGHRRRGRLRLPPLRSLDVWFSEPASVEERRRRLLRHLGLAGDPALARPGPIGAAAPIRDPGVGRSASFPDPIPAFPSGNAWSRSDGSVVPGPWSKPLTQQQLSSKPPLDARFRILDISQSNRRVDGENLCCDPRYLIKSLDDGREFLVKEFREDGMWNTLSEVGTGRQLTVEEFELWVGKSPIVQELMRRQNLEDSTNSCGHPGGPGGGGSVGGSRWKKRGSWLRSIKNVAGTMVGRGHNRDRRSSDEKDSSSEKGGRRPSSATDDSLDGSHCLRHDLKKIKVRQYGKSHKDLSGLFMSQELLAHNGSIWSIKFSLDGRYLASAGEDRVIHVWEVVEIDRMGDLLNDKASRGNESCNPSIVSVKEGLPKGLSLANAERNHWEKERRAKIVGSRKSLCLDPLVIPDYLFSLSEKPVCSFRGHLDDVLDLSWSKSQYLLSSSMDKTVRLWHMSSNSCLKVFSHSDYVTCIQFNPVDDRYFISGSLDEKVRIWSIPERQVVDWNDLHEMVTAACYTPDGQGALVGSHKGTCHLYDTSDNRLLQKTQVDLQSRKGKSRHKKITGFQFAPGNPSKVLVTSADSRIRVLDGGELVHKFKGFRNTSSQISACLTTNGKHVICASEDSHVYVWRYDDSRISKSKGGTTMTQSYEYFHSKGVTVAAPWPNTSMRTMVRTCPNKWDELDGECQTNAPSMAETNRPQLSTSLACRCIDSHQHSTLRNTNLNRFSDRASATWPEELMTANKQSPRCNGDFCSAGTTAPGMSAWGLAIVTAGWGGEIRTFQNFGFPVQT